MQAAGRVPALAARAAGQLKQTGREALQVTVTHMIDDLRPSVRRPAEGARLPSTRCWPTSLPAANPARIDPTPGDTETTTYSSTLSVQRYLVNLLVEHAGRLRPPVVYEDHPTLQNLVGRVGMSRTWALC